MVKPQEQWNVRREYLRRLKKGFDEHGIEILYPHLTIYPGAVNFSETGFHGMLGLLLFAGSLHTI